MGGFCYVYSITENFVINVRNLFLLYNACVSIEQRQDVCVPGHEHGLDREHIDQLKGVVLDCEREVREILPALRHDIQYEWFNQDSGLIVPHYVTGGSLYTPGTVSIAIDKTCSDVARVENELRLTAFHELFHVMQGFSYVDENGNDRDLPSMIGDALYEGAASIFERDFAGFDGQKAVLPYYADYTLHDESQLTEWTNALIDMGTVRDIELLNQWKFYHDDLGVNHIMYKVGAYLVDTVLEHDPEIPSVDRLAQEDWSITLNRCKSIITSRS